MLLNTSNYLYLTIIAGILFYFYYLKTTQLDEGFSLKNYYQKRPTSGNLICGIRPTLIDNKEDLVNYYLDGYNQYDDWNQVNKNNKSAEELQEINELFIPFESVEEPDDRDNSMKYLDSVNEEKSLCAGEEFLIDEYDDQVDKINSYINYTRKGSMGALKNANISDVYDYMTKGIDRPTKRLKQPLIDPVTNDPIYLNESKNLEKTIRPDVWMYENEHVNHGGHMGNGLFGFDPMDNTNAVYQSPFI